MENDSGKFFGRYILTVLGATGIGLLGVICQYIEDTTEWKIKFTAENAIQWPGVVEVTPVSDGVIHIRTRWYGSYYFANERFRQFPAYGGNR